jgi:uncharacterized protein (TIGR02466 family)
MNDELTLKRTRQSWFGVPIWSEAVADRAAINAAVLDLAARLRAEGGGMVRSNAWGWHSSDDVHRRPELASLRAAVGGACAWAAASLDFDFVGHDLVLDAMWINENRRGDHNKAHVHARSFLSGAYYAKAGPGCGDIAFFDPVAAREMMPHPVKGEAQPMVSYPAQPGLLLVFPSWLRHEVGPNLTDEPRVSVSFNVSYRRRSAVTPPPLPAA